MKITDKRLIDRMDLDQQAEFFNKLLKTVPNAANKYEEIEVSHDPINLLEKIKWKLRDKPAAPFSENPGDENGS